MRIVLGGAVVAVLVQNVLVVRSNANLRESLSYYTHRELRAGDKVPRAAGVDLRGRRVSVPFSDQSRPTIVIGMSVECPFCRKSLASWQRIAGVAAKMDVDTIVVLRDPMPAVIGFATEGNELPGQVVVDPTFETYMAMRLPVVPSTAVISPGGAVSRAWIGEVDDLRATDVLNFVVEESKRFEGAFQSGGKK